ncbi:MAG: glycosyltransferase [Methylotenera sp.]|nr:glycosyltransferase [Methylotenera sp.]MDO9389342.1 glycosyltransferase [Methylotenera sp.]
MRILHLPIEIAGQLCVTAQAQKKLGYEASCMTNLHPFGYPSPIDIVLPNRGTYWLKGIDRLSAFFQTAEVFDVYHYYFARTLLPLQIDARYEKLRGKRLVTEFFGSDVRLPDTEAKRNPYYVNSYHESEVNNRKMLRAWADITDGEVIFPDHSFNLFLEPYFNKIHVVGQRIDFSLYTPSYPDSKSKRVRVMHAPSQQAFKGTVHIERAVENLKRKGLEFDYIRVTGLPHNDAMELYKTADLVIDQLCGGSHGVFACEAMALGKPVICYILPELVSGFPEGFPIINANPDTIESVLEEWVQSPTRLHEVGKQSRSYAERVHDVQKIARDLIRIYQKDVPLVSGNVIDWRKGNDRKQALRPC